jgi:hypothetical protein
MARATRRRWSLTPRLRACGLLAEVLSLGATAQRSVKLYFPLLCARVIREHCVIRSTESPSACMFHADNVVMGSGGRMSCKSRGRVRTRASRMREHITIHNDR